MARVKVGGKDFKKGNPGGPGRPRTPPELKVARKLTKTAFEEICNRFIHMTKEEIKEARKDPSRTQLELIVIAIVEKAIDWGDTSKLNFILARLIGNVTEKVEVKDLSAAALLTPEERAKRLAVLRAVREKTSGPAR